MSQVLEWIDSESISNNPEIYSRNMFARKNYSHAPSIIVQKYSYMTIDETKRFMQCILKELSVEPKGIGVELGAGVAGISNSLLSLYPSIEKVYAVEIVPDVVRLLQTKVTKHEKNEGRLVPVIGSFDEIKLPDQSVDFIIEFDSLHHSFDLNKTLREAARILKSGGILIALDRVHSNALTDAQREYSLNIEYGEPFKKEYGIPLETRLTRRQNGEHEIRESEWRTAFQRAGMIVKECVIFHRKCWRGLIFGFLSQIPFSIRARYKKLQPAISRHPLVFFMFYGLPFLPSLWKKRYRSLDISLSFRGAFLTKTVFVVVKP